MSPNNILLIIGLAEAAARGIPAALDAVDRVKAMAAEGRAPTGAEWDDLALVTDELHDRIQGA